MVSYAVTIDLPNVPDSVRPGMSAQVAVTTAAARNVLAVPAIALNGAAGNYTVRVLGANGAVEVRPVQVGLVTSSLAEIQGGLAEGDTVVTGTTSSLNQSQRQRPRAAAERFREAERASATAVAARPS